MNEQKKYYKVLRTKSRTSCSIESQELRLVYKYNQWTKPKIPNSKLFVFDKLDRAAEFVSDISPLIGINKFDIFPCYVKNPIKYMSVRLVSDCNSFQANLFWDYVNKNIFPYITKRLKKHEIMYEIELGKTMIAISRNPIGTVLCDEVFCLV